MNFLPGWCPSAAFAAAQLTTLSEQASATSTSSSVTGPASIAEGDLLVLLDRAQSSISVPAKVIPSGFTEIADTNDGIYTRQVASYKIADGSEASASLTGMNGAVSNDKALYVFRGDVAITSVNVSTPNAEITSIDPAQQTVSASGGTAPLVVLACYGTYFLYAISPRTFSPAKDGEINSGTDLYLAYKIYNSSPSDVTVDMDDEGFYNTLQSFYIECSA